MEKEEGTIDFLRANPVSGRQVMLSKLATTALATLTMLFLLMPLAELCTGARLQKNDQWATFGLWLPAILEAIAWGTLFSLLTARPLLAVILAITAASTAAHLLASAARTQPNAPFEFVAYLRAAPWRVSISLMVLAADAYLGLRWLDDRREIRKPRRQGAATGEAPLIEQSAMDTAATKVSLIRKPDFSAIFGHLLWQHWCQSKWLKLAVSLFGFPLAVGAFGIVEILFLRPHGIQREEFFAFALAVWFAIMGACVFLPDQEHAQVKYFAEHNVPPRYLWLSRIAPWLTVVLFLSIAFIISLYLWDGNFQTYRLLMRTYADPGTYGHRYWVNRFTYIRLPPIGFDLAVMIASFAVGQWMSMFIRSGLMAGFLAVLITRVFVRLGFANACDAGSILVVGGAHPALRSCLRPGCVRPIGSANAAPGKRA